MVKLLRAVTTSAVYPTVREKLHSRAPDDVWYEPEQGWMIAFPVSTSGVERLVLFVIQPPNGGEKAQLVKALRVERSGGGVQAGLLTIR